MNPEGLKYTKEHEWVKIEGDVVLVGITDYAQASLGDITYIKMAEVGEKLKEGEKFSSVESVKAVSEIFSPLSGEVAEVNTLLSESPEVLNQDPYGKGWIVKLKSVDFSEMKNLMSNKEYEEFLKGK